MIRTGVYSNHTEKMDAKIIPGILPDQFGGPAFNLPTVQKQDEDVPLVVMGNFL